MLVSILPAFAEPIIYFNAGIYDISTGPIILTVDDSLNPEFTDTSSGIQKINVLLSTSIENKSITLVETGNATGIFTAYLYVSEGDYEFEVGDPLQIKFIDTDNGQDTNGIADNIDVVVGTVDPFTLDVKEIIEPLTINENGTDSGEFVGQILLVDNATSNDKIKVEPGDLFIFQYIIDARYAMIMPNPYENFHMIGVALPNPDLPFDDILTASYNNVTTTAIVDDIRLYPGGGSGGVITKPGLVLNVIAALFGSNTAIPPTLGLDQHHKRIVDDGFSFNGNPVDVEQYYTPYPLITTEVGKLNTVKLKIYENRGADNIAHVGLSYGLGKGETFTEGRATIEFDRTFDGIESVTLFDPKNVLGSVNVTTAEINCSIHNNAKCLEVTFDHIFRDSLEYNMVATNIWDFQRNGWQNYFNHGIQITGESMNPPEQFSGIYQGHIYHLTETGKNTAVDDDGNTWTFDKTWSRDYKKQVPADTDILNQDKINAVEKLGFGYADAQEIFGFDRVDHRFENTKQSQQLQAQNIMKNLCPECQDKPFDSVNKVFSYDIPNRHSKLDTTLLQMKIEDKKAQEFLKQYFDKIYSGIKYR